MKLLRLFGFGLAKPMKCTSAIRARERLKKQIACDRSLHAIAFVDELPSAQVMGTKEQDDASGRSQTSAN